MVGLAGLIGAGRAEFGHAPFGMTRPERGTIRLEGREVCFRTNRDAIAAGAAYVSEDRLALSLIQPRSVADNAVMSDLRRMTGPSGLLSVAARGNLVAE